MHFNFARNIYFPLTQRLRGLNVLESLKFLEKTQWYSLEEIKKIQWKNLMKILKHSAENVPYYKNKIFPEKIKSYEDFMNVSILTKDDVRENMAQMLYCDYSGYKFKCKTSGSTGLAIEFYTDVNCENYDVASRWRARRWSGVDIGDKEVALWGRPVYSKIVKLYGGIKARLQNMYLISAFDLSESTLKYYWKEIKRYKPVFLYGYATALDKLAEFVKNKGKESKDLKLKAIFSTAETLYQHSKELLKSVFGCPVAIEYGCSEIGGFAYECQNGGLHISAENVFVEFLKDGYPVKEGEIGEIVVTSLTNYYMPFIRYKIGDMGIYNNIICLCGRRLPLMELKVAKIEEMIQTKDGKIFSAEIFDYINLALISKNIRGIKQFKVYQNKIDRFLVQIVKDLKFSETAINYFEKKMKEFLGENISIDFEFVSEIPRDETGKLRYFISKLK